VRSKSCQETTGEMASDFKRAINAMKAVGTEEYLKSSLTVLKIMQNIMVHPDMEKFRKIRLAASVWLGSDCMLV